MLELVEVRKEYDSPGSGERVCVLRDVTLAIEQGQSAAIVGPSGSGKSTLLNIMGALDKPTAGRVRLGGEDMTSLAEDSLAEIRNSRIGFIFQLHHLLPQCSVLENVLVPSLVNADFAGPEAARGRGLELLERVGMIDFAFHRPGELSGGQRQRVAVARALINSPEVLLADEPTGSLDSSTSDKVMDFLVELNESENVSLVLVTHSKAVARRAGRLFELDDGVLRESR